ncbi:MAG: Tex-like N-terminal domain-containing protein, partial [Verrucomicrobiota bacterium]
MALTLPKSDFSARIAKELALRPGQVQTTATLLSEGATIPFLARYRKEATGSLDEVAIAKVRDRLQQLGELESRREAILKSLKERDHHTEELGRAITNAETLNALEDLYAPFRPKRRTRATIAKERGLEALANFLLNQQGSGSNPKTEAANYINPELEVPDVESALGGARNIIAEQVSDDPQIRREVRRIFETDGVIVSKVIKKKEADPDAAKFRDYFDWSEKLKSIPSHRLLAMRRGEKEGFLRVQIEIPNERGFRTAEREFVTANDACGHQVTLAAEDGCKRLLFPSMETEMRTISRRQADEDAVRVFAENLRELLLASPLGQKRVLALDPGFRTGCKTVCLDAQGQLLTHDVIHIIGSPEKLAESASRLTKLVQQYKIEAIAIGNGTASRETESFVKELGLPGSPPVVMVNESGASIYSASEVARKEFPNHDVTVRGAASIGRRLMDP